MGWYNQRFQEGFLADEMIFSSLNYSLNLSFNLSITEPDRGKSIRIFLKMVWGHRTIHQRKRQ